MMPTSHFAMTARRGKLPILKRPARAAAAIDLPGDGSAAASRDFLLPRTSIATLTGSDYCELGELKLHLDWIRQLERPIEARDACKLLFSTFHLSADPTHMQFLLDSTADDAVNVINAVNVIDAVYAIMCPTLNITPQPRPLY